MCFAALVESGRSASRNAAFQRGHSPRHDGSPFVRREASIVVATIEKLDQWAAVGADLVGSERKIAAARRSEADEQAKAEQTVPPAEERPAVKEEEPKVVRYEDGMNMSELPSNERSKTE